MMSDHTYASLTLPPISLKLSHEAENLDKWPPAGSGYSGPAVPTIALKRLIASPTSSAFTGRREQLISRIQAYKDASFPASDTLELLSPVAAVAEMVSAHQHGDKHCLGTDFL